MSAAAAARPKAAALASAGRGDREHARAVIVTLREAVGEQEFRDITVQLPDEYVTALTR